MITDTGDCTGQARKVIEIDTSYTLHKSKPHYYLNLFSNMKLAEGISGFYSIDLGLRG